MTAVEWLGKKLIESGVNLLSEEIEFIQQALEMEKQERQKVDKLLDTLLENNMCFHAGYKLIEQFYSETYKKEKCICKNAELEKDSLVPVYCHNCNVYIQRNL